MVGSADEGLISICGVETRSLIDSGSMITSISESFYKSLNPIPELKNIKEFGLSVPMVPNYLRGYIEAEIKVPCLGTEVFHIPLLVVADTKYNTKVPAITGTNVIRLFRQTSPQTDIPVEWTTAFDSLCNDTLPVKTCNNYNIRVGPGEVKVLHGIVRKTGKMDTAVREHIDSSLSGVLTICPRVVSLKSPGTTVRISVRVCNLSAHVIKIPPKSLLCSLTGVDVVDSWDS